MMTKQTEAQEDNESVPETPNDATSKEDPPVETGRELTDKEVDAISGGGGHGWVEAQL
jgi:hypothetical protein